MKKVVLAMLACSVVATAGGLVACNGNKPAPEVHEHTWSMTHDASQHWLACSGCEEKKDISEHDILVKNDGSKAWGECVCGVRNENVMEAMMNSLVKHGSDVKSGTTTFMSGTEGKLNTEYAETAKYEYRNGYLFVETFYMGEVQYTDYYMLKKDGTPYSVRVATSEYGGLQQNPEEYSENNLRGYRFNSIIYDSELNFYGAEELISLLYKEAVASLNEDFVESYSIVDGKVVGSFTFGEHDAADGYFFRLSIEFTVSELGYLESAKVVSGKYKSDQFKDVDGCAVPLTQAEYAKVDPDFVVEEGKENEEVAAFYNWEITLSQSTTCENENLANPYDPEVVLFQSVDFQYADGTEVPEVITMEAMTRQLLYVRNLVPETAIAALNPEKHTIDGEEVPFLDPYSRLMVFYNKEDSYINISAQRVIGSFEVTFNFGALYKTFIINVIPATPTELNATVSDGKTFTPSSTAKTYQGMNLSFKAVAPEAYFDTTVTASITSANANLATITWDEELGEYVFNASEVGTYVIQMVSVKNPNVVASLTITVNELPDVASLLSGTYQYERTVAGKKKVDYIVTFEPSAAGALNGTVTVEWVKNGTDLYFYTYDPVNGFCLTWISGAETGVIVAMGETFNLYIERNGVQYPLAGLDLGEDENKDETAGYAMYDYMVKYSGVYENGMDLGGTWYSNAKVVFAPNHPTAQSATTLAGTIEFTAGQDSFTGTATYSFTVSGGLVINLENNKWVKDDIEYAVSINSDEMIVITRTKISTGSSATWQLTQMNTEPDAYKNGTKETISSGGNSGVVGDTLQGSGTMLDPYVLVDGATVALTLSGSAAHAVFTFTATSNGYLTFAEATNATIFVANNVGGVISPEGDALNLSTDTPNHFAVTAGTTYYFMVYSAGNGDAVSFNFWAINS